MKALKFDTWRCFFNDVGAKLLALLACLASGMAASSRGSTTAVLKTALGLTSMMHCRKALLGLLAITLAGIAPLLAEGPPTPEEYVSHVGGGAEIVPAGQLKLDNRRMICGQRPTVLDNQLDDYGAAYPGFLILNPRLLARVSTPVKLWIHAHECGHQFRGADEETADCFAVQRGRREGWLTTDGLEEVCRFIAPAKGDTMHFAGSHRCEYMRLCYVDPTVR